MSHAISPERLTDNTVYGIPQTQYTVDDVQGLNFIDAVTNASFKVAVAIEDATSSYSSVIRMRQKKIDELGNVLAYIAEATAKLDPDAKSDDEVTLSHYSYINDIVTKYELSIEGLGQKMKNGNIQKFQTEVQYQIDKENNYLQQDIVSVQSYVSKRDNAYSTAATIVRKSLNAADSTISNMGG